MHPGDPIATAKSNRHPATAGAARWLPLALPLACSLAIASPACAAAFIDIVTSAVTLTPTATDYENDYVEAVGPAGIILKVKNTLATGLVLLVRSSDPSPQIAPGDLLVRTLTPPGRGGLSLATYTAVSPSNLTLWSAGVQQGPFVRVEMDVRIRNLFNYDDSGTPGATPYTSTLVFTVLEP